MAKRKVYKGWVIALSCVCGVLALALIISLWITNINYTKQLENLYQRTYLELVGNVDDLEVDFSKLIATNSLSSQNEILRSLYVTCVLANAHLNALPISNNKIQDVNSFINTCGGYVYSLVEKTTGGDKLSVADFENVEEFHTKSAVLLYDLNSYASRLAYDFKISKNIDFGNGDKSDFNAGIIASENASSEVPALIYDGPFSDSVLNRKVLGLPEVEITKEQADERVVLLNNYYKNSEVEFLGETENKFSTYNYKLSNEEGDFFAQFTKRGGMLINITSYGGGDGDKNLTIAECENLAQNITQDFEFENLHAVWTASHGHITYVNMAPIVDKVIYYPDLIKIKIDNTTGMVIGFEATNYAYNNRDRGTFSYNLGILDAKAMLSSALTVKMRNFCVIPNKFVGERRAFEFVCEWKDYVYYVYLDAETGAEVNIMREIKTNNYTLML